MWAKAMRETRLYDLVVEVDLLHVEGHDLSNRKVVDRWVWFLRAGYVITAHFGILCARLSLAVTPPVRNTAYVEGLPGISEASQGRVDLGNTLAAQRCLMILGLVGDGGYLQHRKSCLVLVLQPCTVGLRI